MLGLCVGWPIEAFRRLTVCVCVRMWMCLSVHVVVWVVVMCWSVTCSRLYASTEAPVLSECQYDSSPHKHLQALILIALCLLHASLTHICTHTKKRDMCHSLFDRSYHIARLSRFNCVDCHLSRWSWTWQLGVNHPDIGSRDKPWRGSKRGHGSEEL